MTELPHSPVLLCIGDIDMDIIIRVPSPPGRDQKVDGARVAQTAGGMAANVAVGASRLGTKTRLLGTVGDDAMGREALAALRREALDLSHVTNLPGVATFFCVIMVDDEGEKSLVKAVSPAYLPQPRDVKPAAFDGVAHMHLTFTRHDLAERAISLARAAGVSISLDLEAADLPADGGQVAELVEQVDLLFVSEQSRKQIEGRLAPLRAQSNRTIVTTLGSQGARVETADTTTEVDGHSVGVTDTSGAGDAFAAAYLHAHLGGESAEAALGFANAAAAISIRSYGAQDGLPTRAEVEAFLGRRAPERSNA
ncbi:carbohydrate kinase family protein [Palleronia abyssalis]|uniref:2-dehydro-3-deoxygluconokinase n=1 Tax=Palleronia abyssalis TaxID=1501240 RepID=A0A2R8BWM4_9RHOB|nr:carbohydrate kinase family protein [Palleronia abyssalis]SPJ24567.1 2-dehydro-3-deoxygluconokinase [Palleronia abyssalis]